MTMGSTRAAMNEVRPGGAGALRAATAWRSVFAAVALLVALPLQAGAQTILNTILDRVNTAVSAASAARSAAEEMRTRLRAGVTDLTGDLQTLIDEAADDAHRLIQEEREGRDQFLPGGACAAACTAFRADLVALLTSVRDVSNAVFDATELATQPDLSMLIAAVEAAPGRMLYPMYRVSSGVLDSGLPDRLQATVADLVVLREAVLSGPPELPDQCALILSRSQAVERASYGGTGMAAILGLVGKVFSMVGQTEFEGYAAGWGWVGGTIKGNNRKKVGEFLSGVSTGLSKVSTYAHNKLRYCALLEFQNQTAESLADIRSSLAALDLDLSNLDAPVSTRATQASVDGVQASLRTIGADVAALVDGQGGTGGGSGGSGSMALRVDIERQLSTRAAMMSVFYLPEAFGGLLERVRDVVADAILQNEAAGLAVGEAWRFLSRGDEARTGTDYRTSYVWYQTAYHQVAGGRPGQVVK